jgi:tyrosyl-tRNA synthetase
MSAYKSEFLQVLADRGFIHQVSDAAGLDARAAAGPITAYVGLDATASSLHIGNLLTIMMLRWVQKTGHRPIALMGGGTSKIGDPSGKDASRTMLANEQIDANIASIRTVFDRFLDFSGGAMMANNADWLDRLTYIPFLREVGRHFTINRMLTFDSVKLRLDREQPLTFLEFNYMILQAYDFVELYKRHGCILQMGGSDQWGNIINGVELGRRMLDAELFALTTPLLLTSAGTKMGKTETGSVWLNADMMSPYEYWQFWRNCDDADVRKFLKLFTELPLDEIGRLAALKDQEIDEAKTVLATEATALLHGRDEAIDAAATARTTFEEGGLGETLPVGDIPETELDGGIGVLNAFVRAGLVPSTSEARRQIKGGGLRVNDNPVSDEKMVLTRQNLTPEGVIKLSLGRKRHVLLGRVSERQVADAACKVLATQPNRAATIKTLVNEIPKYLNLSPADRARSTTRPNEAVWEQQIRNIRSHHKSPSNFIYQGLLEGTEGGLRLTDAGLLRLKDEKLL